MTTEVKMKISKSLYAVLTVVNQPTEYERSFFWKLTSYGKYLGEVDPTTVMTLLRAENIGALYPVEQGE
jgi:hypothetical protein